ncbi:two-component system sensor histidine kinase NtrB [Robertmurraya kyonggiensis]|uniref:histidine kinase n=1 Tax=Robertmurraya kyonggiensis TaxID=1037680 RepID=A0A4U1D9S3_9BACI|nr:ATP-binding protein [Robertmurraya kyonggiensis]TKC19252.1 GHKL domain-containing protein [Robertmurraya kyonggiensis]
MEYKQSDIELSSFEKLKKEFDEMSLQTSYLANVGQLAAGIAHEIRNPLTTIKGFIQLMKPYLVEIEKEEYAKIALEEIERANTILYEFLNAAKPHVNAAKQVEVNRLVKEIAILFEGEAHLKNISICTKLAPENPSLFLEEHQLKQVLVNLVKNAFEAVPATGGEIGLNTEVRNELVLIRIEDNGCGMSDETVRRIFTPFYTTKATGTGLGLSVCNDIIHQLGGEIEIKSQPGVGTDLLIYLPKQSVLSN